MSKQKTTIGRSIAIVSILIAVSVAAFSSQHDSDPYLRAFVKNEFSMTGELAFFDSEETWYNHVVEFRHGMDYGIKYEKKSFFMIDGQYYIEDEVHGYTPVSVPDAELYQIEEMYARASVLSNYNFSNAEFLSSFSVEIPALLTGEPIVCNCEEYELADVDIPIRMYFFDGELYAIQAKDDPRFLFYVCGFSEQSDAFT